MTDFDWVIIGGGIHGVHLGARLIAQAEVDASRIRIVDPGEQLLSSWRSNTAATGMKHLRSPSVHHLDIEPWSLLRFAGKSKNRPPGLFAPPYDRPALDFFNRHCDWVIEKHGLSELHTRARARSCRLAANQVVIRLDHGEDLHAKRVILAMGSVDQPLMPDWAMDAQAGIPMRHVFDPRGWGIPSEPATIAVVGAGISGAQIALRVAAQGHRVELISRHKFREHQFDSDPGWLGPKYMRGFSAQSCLAQRRSMITQARHRGSAPRDVLRCLKQAISRGEIRWHQDEVEGIGLREPLLHLASEGRLAVDAVLLATGFCPRRPGGRLVDGLIAESGLACAPCGYPIVGPDLAWSSRVFVSGPLAELELGPTSRNIAGARRAGDRLVKAARQQPSGGERSFSKVPVRA